MLYEDQAAHYDERAAIPVDAAARAAAVVNEIAGLSEGRRVLEIGVGTGLFSMHLLTYPVEYVGFDRSPAMLEVFAQKAAATNRRVALHVGNGNERWPADDHSIDIVFCARALHHLAPDHVVAELNRVLSRDGGFLIVAKVVRPKDSPKSEVRRNMRHTLRARGLDARNHERHTDDVFDLLESAGALRSDPIVAARWTTVYRPIDSIDSWTGKEGLGGVEIDARTKRDVLDQVHAWASEHFGSVEREFDQEEFIELYTIRIGIA